jgi:hypothetical protein
MDNNTWSIASRVRQLSYVLRRHRAWHADLQQRFDLHPAVSKLLDERHVPKNWHLLVLEWPHVSEVDPSALAYTQTEAKGMVNLQTRVKPGRYLKRHFPQLADDVIRDLVANIGSRLEFTTDMDTMIEWMQEGPHSCMSWEHHDPSEHPYNVYDPEYGWGMARLMHDGAYCGRALVFEGLGVKGFVRTYGFDVNGKTCTHDAMQSLLVEHGYTHLTQWPAGARLARIDYCETFLLPYIDGNLDTVKDKGSYLLLHPEGEYTGDNTNGEPSGIDMTDCDECGDRVPDDALTIVGRDADQRVCNDCLQHRFTYVTGRFRHYTSDYYIAEGDAVRVDSTGQYYDPNHLPNNIVRLHDDEYADTDVDEVVNIDGDYYFEDDVAVVYSEVRQEHFLRADCVRLCAASSYSDDWVPRSDASDTRDGWVSDDDDDVSDLDWASDRTLDLRALTVMTESVEIDGKTYRVHVDDVDAAIAALSINALPLFATEA